MDKIFSLRFCMNYAVLFLLILLNACTHVSKPDGPPNFYVDASKVPDAVPKVEKHSKYGNYSTYHVFGKPYHVMKSSKNYVAVGTASWYGTKFHSRSTSSGERYNMLSMTAAHKTLPLPTYAEVTNLRNHRKIIVKINDRGPFVGNRLIDLSYVAARKLGMMGNGTTLVKVRAIDPATWGRSINLANKNKVTNTHHPVHVASKENVTFKHVERPIMHVASSHSVTKKQVAKANTQHGVYLQVGAFRSKSNAENLRKRLTSIVASNIKIRTSTHPVKKLYRVEIGPFKDKASATKMSKRLKLNGLAANDIKMNTLG